MPLTPRVPMGVRGITETKEGRLTVIVTVAGTLLVAIAAANVWMANRADEEADEIRGALRGGLASVPDAVLAQFPDSGPAIEEAAHRALAGRGARLVRITQPDDDEIVVAVESSWGWQLRCVEAELRGDGTVLTYHDSGPC
ncbi:MAG TPA: hypothetical protein VIL48_14225 [Acidimicrobiales bacterium]